MPKPTMQEALSAIREVLGEPEALDADQRSVLGDLQEDIERALEATEELHGDTGSRVQSTSAGLVERLGMSRPALTGVLGRLADTLASLGI